MPIGKRMREMRGKVPEEPILLRDALALVKQMAVEKFDATCDMAIRLGVDPRKAEENIRGSCPAPAGLGRKVTVLAFVGGEKLQEAKDAGADIIGDEEIIEKIQNGWLEFDKVVATPDQMKSLAKLGRVLGPKKLMPSPKDGTVSFEISQAIALLKTGQINFRVDKAGIVHAQVGKVSFDVDALYRNAMSLMETLVRLRPASVKGRYIKSIHVSSTMGPSVKVDPKVVVDETRVA
ncbi:MAG: 50S ribosomal protein L1 [Candidatus Coatesbacteria bacterium RBG_13_66_14]|uniref:Large ribosomal subunit protein uL1 n=1 Tax=Candidatus Coatesbacteria bacterium RBG_13_66_14 TaxID=1817816 RepID=A0A1F5FHL2_9BACT|nr:MAG: 50S ribosomal protein L1 [Candidatus Coatesbacteria bacterium RBG_13_66_14]